MSKDIAIILPVYNENESLIKDLLKSIFQTLPSSEIFLIDDSLNSKRRKIDLQTFFKTNNNLKIISRNKKLGRGDAVLHGFKLAYKNKKIQYFLEMDSDYSHDPKEIIKFLNYESKSTSDVIIGSRYLKKSQIHNWPLRRLLQSRIINSFLNLLLNVKINDYTNGFRLYNRKAITYLLKKNPREKGFIMLSESIYILKKGKFKISEIPITFTDRKEGKSSVGITDLISSLQGAFRIKIGKYD